MDTKETLAAISDDVKAVLFKIENAISAHNSGTLTPTHLAEARDAAIAAVTNAESAAAEPAGSPVPDSSETEHGTAGTVQKPSDEDIADAGTAHVGQDQDA